MNNFIELMEYNVWANKRVLSQIKYISHEAFIRETNGCFPSIRHAVIHILRSDSLWLDRWKGLDFMEMPDSWNDLTAEGIERIWPSIQINTIELLKSKLVRDKHEMITISNGRENKLEIELWQTIDVVMNHGAYHRGQIANMIESFGIPPIRTQLLDYYLRRHGNGFILA